MSAQATDRKGRAVRVNDSDTVRPMCMNCQGSGTPNTLRVAFIADVPPAGRAYWVHPGCSRR